MKLETISSMKCFKELLDERVKTEIPIEYAFQVSIYVLFTSICHQTNSTINFRTSNKLERVHLFEIELEQPIFGFDSSNIELGT